MNKVLMIANQFPPLGGSGVQRSVKFVKHLPSFNYDPVVFTREEEGITLIDNTLLKDIGKNTQVIRTKSYEPTDTQGSLRIPMKIASKLMIPDSSYRWYKKNRKEALKVLDEQDIKLVYTTSAPYSDHLLGMYLKKKRPHIQWIADFRDEWTNNPYTLDNPHNPVRTAVEKNMEKNVLNKADFLITNTPVMRDNFIKLNGLDGGNFHVIPNGYDEEDFEDLQVPPNSGKEFIMIYTGALYGRRKPDLLFQSIHNLKDRGVLREGTFKLRLIGNYHEERLNSQIQAMGLSGEVEVLGYVPHDVCVAHQLSGDCLLLLEGGGVGANAFYTGKIFEYMNTGRPVLSILPNGVARDLVLESGIGIVANTESIDDIEQALSTYYNQWRKSRIEYKPNFDVIKQYERKNLTAKLAGIFDTARENAERLANPNMED